MKKIATFFALFLFSSIQSQSITTVFSGLTSNSNGIAIKNNLMYIASPFNGFIYTIDISQSNPEPQIFASGLNGIQDIIFQNDYLFASLNPNSPGTDKIIRIDTSLASPVIEDVISIANPNGIAISNSTLYINSQTKLYKVYLNTTPLSAIEIATDLNTVFGTNGLVVTNGFLFVSDNNKLVKYDLSQSNPTKLTVATGLDNITGINLGENNNILYAATYPSAIYKINVSDNTFSTLFSTSTRTNWELLYNSNSIYISNLEGGDVIKVDLNSLSNTEFQPNGIKIYPNPSNDYVTLENCSFISLTDLFGAKIDVRISDNKIDVKNLSSGVYFITLKSNEKTYTQKIIRK